MQPWRPVVRYFADDWRPGRQATGEVPTRALLPRNAHPDAYLQSRARRRRERPRGSAVTSSPPTAWTPPRALSDRPIGNYGCCTCCTLLVVDERTRLERPPQ